MRFIMTLKAILQILPLLVQFIDQLEELFPESGKGRHKLEILKNILNGSYEAVNEFTSIAFEEIWEKLQGTISAIVNLRKDTTVK